MIRKMLSLAMLATLTLGFLAACSSTSGAKPYSVTGDSSGRVVDSKGHPRPSSSLGR